ncbi:MAG: phosphoribosylpyrophosphate synthetase [Bacteroidetes bacterium]|nr:phosphoribosylpyrophosphate synthetase [Bacteroidota bacterium]MBS1931159.1 phosphoribosylpyrophosphate synthetase [Bacteroidota bacterium]
MFTYDTITAAIKGLKDRGFIKDFNLQENCIICHEDKYHPDDFEIVEFYRFEGNSDPGDEAVVYGIESKNGVKGVLISGYGASAIGLGAEMAKKISINRV